MRTQIWQHIRSGEKFVVTLNGGGAVVEAAGPLHWRDIPAALAGEWGSEDDLVEDLAADPDSYRNVTDQARREQED